MESLIHGVSTLPTIQYHDSIALFQEAKKSRAGREPLRSMQLHCLADSSGISPLSAAFLVLRLLRGDASVLRQVAYSSCS